MQVRFWGTRGSISASLSAADVRGKVRRALQQALAQGLTSADDVDAFIDNELAFAVAGTYGGNTSCVEIDAGGDDYILCDVGTGVREFATRGLRKSGPGRDPVYNVFVSHVHWDHIMGFPFFIPAYIPGAKVRIHGCHETLEQAFRTQHSDPNFPVQFDDLMSSIEFIQLDPDQAHSVCGVTVRAMKQRHAGDSFGYRFEKDGKVVVYATDSEHDLGSTAEIDDLVGFFADADILIFDAMYSLAEAVSLKEDWGHSSNMVGVELAQRAGVKHFCLFHHEPLNDDDAMSEIVQETRRFAELSQPEDTVELQVSAAYDGMEVVL